MTNTKHAPSPGELKPTDSLVEVLSSAAYFLGSEKRRNKRHRHLRFVPPGNFPDHLDFFLRLCACCAHSRISVQIYTEEKQVGEHIHPQGQIILDAENIGDHICDPDCWPEGYIREGYSYIYQNPGYARIGSEDTYDRLRLTFREPECFLADYPPTPLGQLLKQYHPDTWVIHRTFVG